MVDNVVIVLCNIGGVGIRVTAGIEVEVREGVECGIKVGVGVVAGAEVIEEEGIGVGVDPHVRSLCIHLRNEFFLFILLELHLLYIPASPMQRFR
jgi:hypothetical protein